jgi:hypothetical protein
MDSAADFEVRCCKCHVSTNAHQKPEDAIKQWNSGEDIECVLDLFIDNLDKNLQGYVEEILIADDDMFWAVNAQSCDANAALLKINGKIVYIVHDGDTIGFDEISEYNPDFYCHVIKPSQGKSIVFRKVLRNEDGVIEGLEFGWGERYLFIFASEDNIIITKSIINLYNDITWDEIPDFDDSVLFAE